MSDRDAPGSGNLNAQSKPATNDFIAEVCFSSLSYLIFAILYGIYTSDPRYYGGEACVDLYKWGRYMFYLSAVGAVFYGVVGPLIYCTGVCSSNNIMKSVSDFSLYSIRIGLGLASLVIFIALCSIYAEKEPCESLATLTLVYIIIVGVAIGLGLLIACCLGCCALMGGAAIGGAALGGMAAQKYMNYGSQP